MGAARRACRDASGPPHRRAYGGRAGPATKGRRGTRVALRGHECRRHGGRVQGLDGAARRRVRRRAAPAGTRGRLRLPRGRSGHIRAKRPAVTGASGAPLAAVAVSRHPVALRPPTRAQPPGGRGRGGSLRRRMRPPAVRAAGGRARRPGHGAGGRVPRVGEWTAGGRRACRRRGGLPELRALGNGGPGHGAALRVAVRSRDAHTPDRADELRAPAPAAALGGGAGHAPALGHDGADDGRSGEGHRCRPALLGRVGALFHDVGKTEQPSTWSRTSTAPTRTTGSGRPRARESSWTTWRTVSASRKTPASRTR